MTLAQSYSGTLRNTHVKKLHCGIFDFGLRNYGVCLWSGSRKRFHLPRSLAHRNQNKLVPESIGRRPAGCRTTSTMSDCQRWDAPSDGAVIGHGRRSARTRRSACLCDGCAWHVLRISRAGTTCRHAAAPFPSLPRRSRAVGALFGTLDRRVQRTQLSAVSVRVVCVPQAQLHVFSPCRSRVPCLHGWTEWLHGWLCALCCRPVARTPCPSGRNRRRGTF